MKTFFFFLVLIIFVVCIMQKTNNKPGEDTNYPLRMMIIENHLTGEIDTVWFDETHDSVVLDSVEVKFFEDN